MRACVRACVSEEPYGQNGGPPSPFEMKRQSDRFGSSRGRGDPRVFVPEFRRDLCSLSCRAMA